MIANRRAASPTGPVANTPSLSGPRCTSVSAIGARAPLVDAPPSRASVPQMPHMATPAARRIAATSLAPRCRTRNAVATIRRRYSPTDRSASHSRSCASFSVHDMSRAIRSCANPVSPGRTTSRCQYCGISSQSCSKNTGRIGRGPTSDMSPCTTFQSCGSSSRCMVRSNRPTRVSSPAVRSSRADAWYGPRRVSASGISVRSLYIVNISPARPTRRPR